jgi:pantothenate kinase type III
MNKFILTCDIGNSNQTLSLFDKDETLLVHEDFSHLDSLIENYNLNSQNTTALVSSVKDSKLFHIPVKTYFVRDLFKDNKFLEMPVNYSKTLGDDRIVTSYFLYKKDNHSKVIIDTGSFTTIDQVDIKGFNGGHILPGLAKIQETYYQGEKLSEIAMAINFKKQKLSSKLPLSSETAITDGILVTYIAPIIHLIKNLAPKEVYLTGGNSIFLNNLLKDANLQCEASIHLDNSLIHRSLCFIANRI